MNSEFKRMMQLAGLTEIKVTNPALLNLERFKDIKTLEELEKALRSLFPKSSITLEDEAEIEDTEDTEEAYVIVIDNIDIAPGAYQLWDTYDNPTGEEKSFMNTLDLLEYLKEKLR